MDIHIDWHAWLDRLTELFLFEFDVELAINIMNIQPQTYGYIYNYLLPG